jgi:hypothetical protein
MHAPPEPKSVYAASGAAQKSAALDNPKRVIPNAEREDKDR